MLTRASPGGERLLPKDGASLVDAAALPQANARRMQRDARAQTREYRQDTILPPRYGITPWNARGSSSNTSGRN